MTQEGSLFCGNCWVFYSDCLMTNPSIDSAFNAIVDRQRATIEDWLPTDQFKTLEEYRVHCNECFNPDVMVVTK